MRSEIGLLKSLRLELDYFSGLPWLRGRKGGGAGVVVRFERVRPHQVAHFQPRNSREITPKFLDRMIQSVKRWNFEVISIDEVCRRAVTLPTPTRFVSLTFDGGYKDVVTSAYPVLSRHGVPFTIYLPTAFPDGIGEAWWLALDEVIARENRISLVMNGEERHFSVERISEKYQLYDVLEAWMLSLAPIDLSLAIRDICKRYSVDLQRLSREPFMTWEDLNKLAADPLVTIGTATVNYPMLAKLREADAAREMAMGKAVAEAALRRDAGHFAYPFGDSAAFRRQDILLAHEAGFISAASAISGVVEPEGRTNLHALPRLNWDGRRSLRVLRVLLSGRV